MAWARTGMVHVIATCACAAACAATPPAAAPPSGESAAASQASPRSASSAAPRDTGAWAESATPPPSPAFGPLTPEAVDPTLPLLGAPADDASPQTVAYALLESSIGEAWTTSAGLFLMTARAHQGSDLARQLPYPSRAAEAAESGRVVVTTQVWRVTPGRLTRVLETPTQLRPLDCIADEDCTLLDRMPRLLDDGAVGVDHAACPAALAALAPAGAATSIWEAYDRAVVPAICARASRFAWNGRAFAASRARIGTTESAERVPAQESARRMLETLLGASLDEVSLRAGPAGDGRGQHLLLRRHVPAAADPTLLPTPQAHAWRSGRAIEVAELWLATYGALRRTLALPVALRALAAPLVVTRQTVTLDADELQIGGDGEPCRADSGFDPATPLGDIEAAHARLDQAAADRICAGRGRYRFDGRAFTRTH